MHRLDIAHRRRPENRPSRLLPVALLVALAPPLVGCQRTGKPTVVYLARHGQTAWNRMSRFQGNPDLDQVGYINRVSLWLLLRDKKIDAIYTSKLLRTRRTAALIAKQKKLKIQPRADLNEIRSGIYEGICWAYVSPPDKIQERSKLCKVKGYGVNTKPALAALRKMLKPIFSHSPDSRLPLGESYNDVGRRTRRFVDELNGGRAGRTVLVVGHGVINRLLLQQILGWPLAKTMRIRQANDQVWRFENPGTPKQRLFLYTPGTGWRRCTKPKRDHLRKLDCHPKGTTNSGLTDGPKRKAAAKDGAAKTAPAKSAPAKTAPAKTTP